MIAGRRSLLLSVGFLTLAVFVTNSTAQAQAPSHKILKGKGTTLTPEQIRQALAALGAGEGLDGELDPFQQMVKDYLLKNNPQLDPKTNPNFDKKQLDDLIKQLTGDKKLMEQLKQVAKQKQTDPGRPGQLNPEELAKLFQTPNGKLPELPPDIKGFRPPIDPKRDPFADPKVDPKVEPKVEPKVDPVDPVNPKVDPKDPVQPPQPPDHGNKNPEKPPIELDKNPFPEPEEATDPRTKSLQAFAALWERNIGPLSETPEVQRALFEAIGENGFDFDMKDEKGNSIWDLLKNGEGTGSDFSDFFRGSNGSSGWSFGNWELPKIGDWFRGSGSSTGSSPSWLGSSNPTPRPSVPSSSWGFSGVSFGGTWLPFILLLLVIVAVFLWLYLKQMRERTSSLVFAGAGLGPWPVDPRSINTREDVVKAFEYVSVLICGPSARNWTHGTIAAALADLATTHGDTAMMLARLYELARYAPLDEPLTGDELVEARKLVCALAGVSY